MRSSLRELGDCLCLVFETDLIRLIIAAISKSSKSSKWMTPRSRRDLLFVLILILIDEFSFRELEHPIRVS